MYADPSSDLPLSPPPQPRPQATGLRPPHPTNTSFSERFNTGYAGGTSTVQHPHLPPPNPPVRVTRPRAHPLSLCDPADRRSIAVIPGGEQGVGVFAHYSSGVYSPDDFAQSTPGLAGGLTRSQTVLRREGGEWGRNASPPYEPPDSDFVRLPTPSEQPDIYDLDHSDPMSGAHAAPKTSSDSGQNTALDRWSQRRLQRLNTEQGFREQRQSGQGVQSPPLPSEQGGYNNVGAPYAALEPQPQQTLHQQPQPHPGQQSAYHSGRPAPGGHANAGLATGSQPVYAQPQQHSPLDSGPQYSSQDALRPSMNQSRSYSSQSQQQAVTDDSSMSSSNNGGPLPPSKGARPGGSNRQSVHNGLTSREGTSIGSIQQQQQQQQQQQPQPQQQQPQQPQQPQQHQQQQQQQQQGVPAFNASVVPPVGHGQAYKGNQSQQQGDVGRATPQPQAAGEDMSEEDVTQLIKDHKELREKYTKVKKYYFEKEDQVKQLQNSLAHQRLSLSKTSLDDSEYTTRFNRLDGLVAQLAFSIRKSWRSIPHWLDKSVNKDAVAIGKQEMTAVGRALISHWLVEEVFNKFFHPDIEPTLSAQLKNIQLNIRRFAPPAHTVEEEEFLTAKVVNWRLSTLEGLQEALRSPQCPQNRATLTDMLKDHLINALAVHLQDPPPSDLEGGVHMIIELVVSIAIHLPIESRDVAIEYYMPGHSIVNEQMKPETGIPALATSVADDAADRASMKSAASDVTDMAENNTNSNNPHGDNAPSAKKRSMLSALTGTGGKTKPSSSGGGGGGAQGKHAGAGGSSSSLNRPESSQGMKDDAPPRVRMAAGIGVQIRGRSVLVKAPVFGA